MTRPSKRELERTIDELAVGSSGAGRQPGAHTLGRAVQVELSDETAAELSAAFDGVAVPAEEERPDPPARAFGGLAKWSLSLLARPEDLDRLARRGVGIPPDFEAEHPSRFIVEVSPAQLPESDIEAIIDDLSGTLCADERRPESTEADADIQTAYAFLSTESSKALQEALSSAAVSYPAAPVDPAEYTWYVEFAGDPEGGNGDRVLEAVPYSTRLDEGTLNIVEKIGSEASADGAEV